MSTTSGLLYAKSHEWVRRDGDSPVTIGISDYAQNSLGDITFVELPKVGDQLTKGDPFGVVESVKAASDLYAPISGEVVEINGDLDQAPEKINQSPVEEGWLIRVKPSDPSEMESLLSEEDYAKSV